MGNCEGGARDQQKGEVLTEKMGESIWGINYKNDIIEINNNKVKATEYEESCMALMQLPMKEDEKIRVKLHFNPTLTTLGVGVTDFDAAQSSEYTGSNTYGLGHGLFLIHTDKQLCCSNNEDLNKKSKGYEIKNDDVIVIERFGKNLNIFKEGSQDAVNFQLDDKCQYHVCAWFYTGWNSEAGEMDDAYVEIL